MASAEKEKGRFRSFLLTMFKRFLADEWDRSRAQKRGGGLRPLTIDTETAEAGYQQDWIENATPERVFEQRWALSVVNRAINRLEAEFTQAGRAAECARPPVATEIPRAPAGRGCPNRGQPGGNRGGDSLLVNRA